MLQNKVNVDSSISEDGLLVPQAKSLICIFTYTCNFKFQSLNLVADTYVW
jgi:hypothetical protein